MKTVVKQVAGIDVAQKELVVSLGKMDQQWTPKIVGHKTFTNNSKGFNELRAWVSKQCEDQVEVRYVMESTGVYHEALAYYLSGEGCAVSIVLPNKISNYFRTLKVRTITDKSASEAICLFGLERKLDDWKRPAPLYKTLRQLTRERDQLQQELNQLRNQKHAELAEAEPNEGTLIRLDKRIKLLKDQAAEIWEEIREMLAKNQKVSATVKQLTSIPGVGALTAVTVLAETNGFDLIRNQKQLTAYAGLDVKEKQSGTSVRGKAQISKRGNRHLRKAMHFPALTAIRHDVHFKAVYLRIVEKQGIKMKAAVAVQRKILALMYTLYRSGKEYDKDYLQKIQIEKNEAERRQTA
ncbi:transposase [Arcticibacter tournemirensis]|uniref:IS110 family transposase n=1 Tax=Arcticibacter tournemirensis TaxID=699437 RepID=UPI0011511A66|nr:IS110 family transposase [Arcticibacter tournemirensis]TQM49100.1 transposase [Arcticibacter tournemirensis]TQM49920.1 transposase [Arcticibacter tournemirensis]